MLWPNGTVNQPRIISPFGPRNINVPGASTNHKGVDLVGFSTVRAVDSGVVTVVGTPKYWENGGHQIWIRHNGYESRYMHLVRGSERVRVGQSVTLADPLATMGRTGVADVVHLHLEIALSGVQVDPVPFIEKRLSSPSTAGNEEGEDMPISILERKDSQLTKSLYDVNRGRAIRPISRDENTAFRRASRSAVVYVTVSDAEYKQRGGF